LKRVIPEDFDIQGHRGARGLLPENTIPGFILAMELGVKTLEMDLAISKDKQVVVSHEPWFSAAFSTHPGQDIVLPVEEESLLLYTMTFEEIKKFDVGRRGHKAFPRQKPIPACKPLLIEVIDTCEKYWKSKGLNPIHYNIEIKSNPDWDNWRTPPVDEFCNLVYEVLKPFGLGERLTIQSFDARALKEWKKLDPSTQLAWLSEKGNLTEELESTLGFRPDIYSPYYKTLNTEIIEKFKKLGYKVIPWTVNDTADIIEVMNWPVDGLITDYPDVALGVLGRLKITAK